MNGSQLGFVTTDRRAELCVDEIRAYPLLANEIDSVLTGVGALFGRGHTRTALFYYPLDWRLGKVIWTPITEKILHVKEKYKTASAVSADEPTKAPTKTAGASLP